MRWIGKNGVSVSDISYVAVGQIEEEDEHKYGGQDGDDGQGQDALLVIFFLFIGCCFSTNLAAA